MAYTKYSLTPANNTAAPPDGAPEGMLPSAVNDTMRDMMAQIRDCGDGVRDGTYTMTTPKITGGTITGVVLTGNTLTNPVITGATLTTSVFNGTVGATTASTGAFTTLTSNGATTFTANTASTSTTTGTTVITGGLGVSGRVNAANFDGIVGANTAAAGSFSTLSASGVATFSAGTNLLPALTTTGDTNTGIFFPAADTIAFAEGGAEAMRINSGGTVRFISTISVGNSTPSTSGAGITFPASQSASSDANTLDDYEEGTWTPNLIGSTANPSSPATGSGIYTKIGRVVTVHFRFNNTNTTGATGTMRVTGLPFTIANNVEAEGACSMSGFGAAPVVTFGVGNQTYMEFYDCVTLGAISISAGSGKYLYASLTYYVD